MKKLILLFALGVSLCANAQLTVYEEGQVRIGNYATGTSPVATLDISYQNLNNSAVFPSGSISFGGGTAASIGGCSRQGKLDLYGYRDINWGVGGQAAVVTLSFLNQSLTSLYSISAPSFLTTSDARLKTNVESLSESFGKLQDVDAVSYTLLKPSTKAVDGVALKNSSDEVKVEDVEAAEDTRIHFGFIAQEIQKIYPNLVVEDEEGMLAIDYTGFIPLLVEAYKDLAGKVKEQEEVIDALLTQKGPSYIPASVNGLANSKASLKQNKPNPFNTTTTIECSVPQSVAAAFICVYDLQGKQVHRIDIRERGDIVNVIDASYFAPGMYIYALIADSVEIDSKRMIITD